MNDDSRIFSGKIDQRQVDQVFQARKLAPELPWNNWDPKQLGPCLMTFMEDQEPFYSRWAETWYQNFQFIYGNQSMRWSRRYGYAVDVDSLRSQPSLSMRAQTNISRTIAESLSALIYSNLPTWEVDAAEESSVKGKRFQRIVQKMLDCYMTRLSMDQEFAIAAMCYVAFGQMAAFIDWRDNAGEVMKVPKWQQVEAPIFTDFMASNQFTGGLLEVPTQAVDANGKPLFEKRWEPVTDQSGRQVEDQILAGDVGCDILTPFEYRREIGSKGAHKTKFWQRIRLLDYDEFLDEYGQLEGRTPMWGGVRPVYNNPAVYRLAVRHFMRMQMTTPTAGMESSGRSQSTFRNSTFRNKVLLVDHYDRPHPVKWPEGRRVVVVNGEAVVIGKPRYHTTKIDGWHPFVEAQWFNVAPSSIASGPMNDVIQKNRELNVADSLQSTALRRNCGSALLIKTGAATDPQRFTGEPGLIHEVQDPTAFRWLHDDMPMSPVIATMRDQMKADVYEISGAQDAIRGERSVGAESGYAQRQIQEREERRLAPARKIFGYFAAGIGEKLWCCLKTNVTKLDDQVMGFLQRAAAGEYQPQDVVAMLSSTVDFGVDINIKPDSMSARSVATQQATLMELLKGPGAARAQNPKVLDAVFKFFDVEHLRDESASHRDRAQRENEVFQDMLRLGFNLEGISKPIVLFEDDDDIHIAEHTEFLIQNSDEVMRNENFLREYLMHVEQHRIQKQEKMGEMPPGTSLQVPNMAASITQNAPAPTIQTIFQGTQLKQQQAQQLQQAQAGAPPQPPGAPSSPQAPSQPAPMGSGGPPQTDPNAPSQNTAPGRRVA